MKRESKCSLKVCHANALWTPTVLVWAKGYPKTTAPIRCETSFGFCEEHKNAFSLKDIPDLQPILNEVTSKLGKVKADVSTAEILLEPILEL